MTHSSSKVAIEKISDVIISRGTLSFSGVFVLAVSVFVTIVMTVVSFCHKEICLLMRSVFAP